jgi:hypothetical protein
MEGCAVVGMLSPRGLHQYLSIFSDLYPISTFRWFFEVFSFISFLIFVFSTKKNMMQFYDSAFLLLIAGCGFLTWRYVFGKLINVLPRLTPHKRRDIGSSTSNECSPCTADSTMGKKSSKRSHWWNPHLEQRQKQVSSPASF